MPKRNDKIRAELMKLAAEFLIRESNRSSLLTVTDVRMSDKGKRAIIAITVLPETREEQALDFVRRKRKELWQYIVDHSRIPFPPAIEFEIDMGEKNRQRIDELLRNG